MVDEILEDNHGLRPGEELGRVAEGRAVHGGERSPVHPEARELLKLLAGADEDRDVREGLEQRLDGRQPLLHEQERPRRVSGAQGSLDNLRRLCDVEAALWLEPPAKRDVGQPGIVVESRLFE